MIIVEGPDGAGKTSLIDRLRLDLDFEVQPRPCTSEEGVDPSTLASWVEQDLKTSSSGFYDRYPLISEPIYGPLIRGYMADKFDRVDWMSLQLSKLYLQTPFIIFCLPPLAEVLRNVDRTHGTETPHLRGVHEHAPAIWAGYQFRAAQIGRASCRERV